MPYVLKNIKLSEISFVDKGANGASPVVFYKRRNQTGNREMTNQEKVEDLMKRLGEISKELEDMKENETKKEDLSSKLIEMLQAEGVSDSGKDAILTLIASMIPKEQPTEKPEEEQVQEQVQGENNASQAMGENKEKVEEEQGSDIKKILDETQVELKKAKEDLEKAEFEKKFSDTVAILKEKTKFVPGDIKKRAERLLKIKDSIGDDAYNEMINEYISADQIIKSSKHFDEKGTARSGDELTPDERINKMASDIVEKSGGKIKFEQAWAQVRQSPINKKLVAESRSEMLKRRESIND